MSDKKQTSSNMRQQALDYHQYPRPGKIQVTSSKPCVSQLDLSLAYTPGVAEPCREIAENPDLADKYTCRANLVAVISNGTAVLGLGNIGALAGKPVMEGKAVLFKRFADIDVFDLEIDETDPQKLIETIMRLEPTFGGINLEDIKAPECFIIEDALKERMNIPVLHDDQHGTAVIMAAGLRNALHLQDKRFADVKVVCNGAGAAAIACMKLIESMGVQRKNIMLVDSKGVVHKDTVDANSHKAYFASTGSARTLAEAMCGADVFIGLSVGNVVAPEMLCSMAAKPVVFAMANPDPEIAYDVAMGTRDDLIMATGRSDHPNQINNVLGFPFLFRGALDVGATTFNDEMKIAAVNALAELARKPVPDAVSRVYSGERLQFGAKYILPKPFDPRLIETVPTAVANAAMRTGVARKPLKSLAEYRKQLIGRVDTSRLFLQELMQHASEHPLRMVLAEGEDAVVIRAATVMRDQGVAHAILLGKASIINQQAVDQDLSLDDITIIDPHTEDDRFKSLCNTWYKERQRHGVLHNDAARTLRHDYNTFAAMLVKQDYADGLISGRTAHYPDVLRPVLRVLGHDAAGKRQHVFGMYLMMMETGTYLLADCTVNINMDAEQLAEIAVLAANTAQAFGMTPRVAMLSYSNFGSADHAEANTVADAVSILHKTHPELEVDGEMQADTAVNDMMLKRYAFSRLQQTANILIFPSMQSGNICYKLLRELGGGRAIGPILVGLPQQAHVLQLGAGVDEFVNMATIAAVRAASED
ncbi:MAG: NADP-dependent malic enzyme [Mariprofundales bacterium]